MTEKKINRRTILQSKIKRIVISKATTPVKETEEAMEQTEESQKTLRPKKACFFCQSKTKPSYTDTAVLRRFVTDRAKIVLRAKSGLCSKHQRAMTKQVKYARHLSLLPFTPKV